MEQESEELDNILQVGESGSIKTLTELAVSSVNWYILWAHICGVITTKCTAVHVHASLNKIYYLAQFLLNKWLCLSAFLVLSVFTKSHQQRKEDFKHHNSF